MSGDFDDLLAANASYAESFGLSGFDGVAQAGIAMVTCMDSRIDPLGMLGLVPGDAKILRNAGGRITERTLAALILSVHLLGVRRILVVAHTRCAVASSTADQLRAAVSAASGRDASMLDVPVVADQEEALRGDVERVRAHSLIAADVRVGGFVYDVDTGRLRELV